jgi:hypothetical protein
LLFLRDNTKCASDYQVAGTFCVYIANKKLLLFLLLVLLVFLDLLVFLSHWILLS